MKIYSDKRINTLYVEGVCEGPVTDFQLSVDATTFSLYRIGLDLFEVKNVPFSKFTDQNGNQYLDQASVLSYIGGLLSYTPLDAVQLDDSLTYNQNTNTLSANGPDLYDGGNF